MPSSVAYFVSARGAEDGEHHSNSGQRHRKEDVSVQDVICDIDADAGSLSNVSSQASVADESLQDDEIRHAGDSREVGTRFHLALLHPGAVLTCNYPQQDQTFPGSEEEGDYVDTRGVEEIASLDDEEENKEEDDMIPAQVRTPSFV